MAKVELTLLRSKFRGTMLGALVGDCLGSPYENDDTLSSGAKLVLQKSLDKLEGPMFAAPVMQYTDDSAMTRCVAESLIENNGFVATDLAKKFVKCYYQDPGRGYGQAIATVFQKLRGNKFNDTVTPAAEQFNGRGSWGNGGAMRVSPVSLFCYNNFEEMINIATETTKLTHTHKCGVNGAILQAVAVFQSLHLNPNEELNVTKFVDDLIKNMEDIEYDVEGLGLEEPQPYIIQLNLVKNLISENKEPNDEKVVKNLGNNIEALFSVPTAIYCFLRAQKPIPHIETDNAFRRTIQYAITLGGDTDTIGSMAGAIAGAFYGDRKINSNLLQHCEASEDFRILGDKLADKIKHK